MLHNHYCCLHHSQYHRQHLASSALSTSSSFLCLSPSTSLYSFSLSSYQCHNFPHIMDTRPKPPFGRQGLAGSWGKDKVRRVNFGVFSTSHIFVLVQFAMHWRHVMVKPALNAIRVPEHLSNFLPFEKLHSPECRTHPLPLIGTNYILSSPS